MEKNIEYWKKSFEEVYEENKQLREEIEESEKKSDLLYYLVTGFNGLMEGYLSEMKKHNIVLRPVKVKEEKQNKKRVFGVPADPKEKEELKKLIKQSVKNEKV